MTDLSWIDFRPEAFTGYIEQLRVLGLAFCDLLNSLVRFDLKSDESQGCLGPSGLIAMPSRRTRRLGRGHRGS